MTLPSDVHAGRCDALAHTSQIDLGRALDLLTEAVERYGPAHEYTPIWRREQRYRTCVYAGGGRPSCIVGHALALAGVPVAALEALSDDGVWELYLAGRLPIDITLGAAIAFHHAQVAQDSGQPWGAAREIATRLAIDDVLALTHDALSRGAECCAPEAGRADEPDSTPRLRCPEPTSLPRLMPPR